MVIPDEHLIRSKLRSGWLESFPLTADWLGGGNLKSGARWRMGKEGIAEGWEVQVLQLLTAISGLIVLTSTPVLLYFSFPRSGGAPSFLLVSVSACSLSYPSTRKKKLDTMKFAAALVAASAALVAGEYIEHYDPTTSTNTPPQPMLAQRLPTRSRNTRPCKPRSITALLQ